jgi:ketosteroid isomerase-like protein
MMNNPSGAPSADGIEAVFRLWTEARRSRDLQGLVALLADDVVFVATDEVCVGRKDTSEVLARDFDRVDDLEVLFGPPRTYQLGDVAWCFRDFTSTIKTGRKMSHLSGRLTVVLSRGPNGWRIAQWHASVPRVA